MCSVRAVRRSRCTNRRTSALVVAGRLGLGADAQGMLEEELGEDRLVVNTKTALLA